MQYGIIAALLVHTVVGGVSRRDDESCFVRMRLEKGWVRGLRSSYNGKNYYSFLNVTYAKQPLGERRFQELEPPDAWEGLQDATSEGPVCPQRDLFYGPLMKPKGECEACIHANIYVPSEAPLSQGTLESCPPSAHLNFNYGFTWWNRSRKSQPLPILVFIHGGGYGFGSGDPDVYGPEYLISKGVIVITFNYRVAALGFLSLDTVEIPGNAGLRDMITLLRWVQDNAHYFGGDPDEVTLAGHSAGAISANLLALSPQTTGLFKRSIMMSSVAYRSFFTLSPLNAARVAKQLLDELGLNETDPGVYKKLQHLPIQTIKDATRVLEDREGVSVFIPVVESQHLNPVIDAPVSTLIGIGRDQNVSPFMIGFTDNECQSFIPRFQEIDMVDRIKKNPLIMVPPAILFSAPLNQSLALSRKVFSRYFQGEPTMEGFINYCSEANFIYPSLKAAQVAANSGKPVYLYKFSYQSERRLLQKLLQLKWSGAAHLEDVLYVFRTNSMPEWDAQYTNKDVFMRGQMTSLFANFIKTGNPNFEDDPEHRWVPMNSEKLRYLDVQDPGTLRTMEDGKHLQDIVNFYDDLYRKTTKD